MLVRVEISGESQTENHNMIQSRYQHLNKDSKLCGPVLWFDQSKSSRRHRDTGKVRQLHNHGTETRWCFLVKVKG